MSRDPRAAVPAVGRLLEDREVRSAAEGLSRPELCRILRETVDGLRAEVEAGASVDGRARVLARVHEARAVRAGGVARAVVNGTGVVLHTNLGRAPLGSDAGARVSAGYSVVEMDLATGRRGRRAEGVERSLELVTGAEAALAVNNNAAAVLLTLRALCSGGEVIVSRGELVEIGGSFRIPDVMVSGGARLREVGTTNRTHLRDYEQAIGPETRAIMVVHPSNYCVEGFTAQPQLTELAELSRAHGVPLIEDQGSGYLVDPTRVGLPTRTTVEQALQAGVDLVTFSGDKILGGPQAGLVVGRRELVDRMRRDPMMRALRLDRFTISALEATLRHYLDDSWLSLPVMKMLAADPDILSRRAEGLRERLAALSGWSASVVPGFSAVGGGAFPEARLPTHLVRLRRADSSTEELARAFRLRPLPVILRVADDALLIDPRTLLSGDEECVVEAAAELGGRQ